MLIFGGSLISFLGMANLYENGPILDEKKRKIKNYERLDSNNGTNRATKARRQKKQY